MRINLAAYFCRQHIQTQERRGDPAEAALIARRPDSARLPILLGGKNAYGWRADDWDDLFGARAGSIPRGLWD